MSGRSSLRQRWHAGSLRDATSMNASTAQGGTEWKVPCLQQIILANCSGGRCGDGEGQACARFRGRTQTTRHAEGRHIAALCPAAAPPASKLLRLQHQQLRIYRRLLIPNAQTPSIS